MTLAGRGRPTVSTLRLVLHVYEDHSFVNISKAVDLPFEPLNRRLGHRRIPLGRADFHGLSTDGVLLLVSRHLVSKLTLPDTD